MSAQIPGIIDPTIWLLRRVAATNDALHSFVKNSISFEQHQALADNGWIEFRYMREMGDGRVEIRVQITAAGLAQLAALNKIAESNGWNGPK